MKTVSEARLRIVESNVIYRNPLPGHQAVSALHPFICPLSASELLASFKVGQAMYSADGMVHLARSHDGGRSWQHEGPFRDRGQDDRPYQYSQASLTRLNDESLLMNNWRCDRSDTRRLYANPETGGSLPLDLITMRSTDGGRSWSDPLIGQVPEPAPGRIHAFGGPVVELKNDRWMQLCEVWNAYDSSIATGFKTYALFSDDEGRTWGNIVGIADGTAEDRTYTHGHAIHLHDGRLFCLLWTGNADMSKFYDLHYTLCDDGLGRKWSRPQPTGIPGQSCYPAELSPGRLAVVYSERDGSKQPGIKVVLSHDGGRTWDLDNHAVVWDAYGKEALGVPPSDRYPTSHDAIAYGAPHLVALDERTLVASFWCTQSADTHCRTAIVRLED